MQETALKILKSGQNVFLTGSAGTGKTYVLNEYILYLKSRRIIPTVVAPTGIAASALYIAAVLCGEKRTQRDIADVVGVTEVTIRTRYKDLVEKLGIEEEVEKKAAETDKRPAAAVAME